MNSTEWGVTDKGFHRPTYVELLDALEYKARELFGAKANLTVRSPLGVFLRIFAWMFNIIFSLMEDVYNSRFVDTSAGTSLYNLGKAIGLRLLPAQKASGYITFTGTPGTVIPSGFLVKTIAGFQYAVVSEGRIGDDGTALLPVQATGTGDDYNVAASTVKEIVNPLDGVKSCTNAAAIDGGRGRETDEEYRDRYYQSVDYAGGVNADAIAGEVLQNVDAVYSALCYENDTDEIDSIGLPAHSFELVVYGGLDQDIAEAIFKRKAAGIQTYGNKTVAVISSSGQSVNINFSRPTTKAVYLQITSLTTGDAFPSDGAAQIKQALIDYIGGDTEGGLAIGADVLYMALPGVILSVPGVVDFDLQIGTDGTTYTRSNIVISIREKAVTDESKVSISI
ncbi:baseplate J/gp47 family protein [Faecalispora jeddahensis]|uniref:baseplate J/gp47 family protein n=1 Tax=Faecalispora jeddahensis TaxID=1414721 RepID=UPI0027BB0205|nr:baseplate J/gp47 family protein [Faecalispora jeddahensis]